MSLHTCLYEHLRASTECLDIFGFLVHWANSNKLNTEKAESNSLPLGAGWQDGPTKHRMQKNRQSPKNR